MHTYLFLNFELVLTIISSSITGFQGELFSGNVCDLIYLSKSTVTWFLKENTVWEPVGAIFSVNFT